MSVTIVADFLIYALGSLFTRGISFIILPLIMQRITPAEYGSLALLLAFFTIITAILGLGLRQFLSLEYFHRTPHEQKALIHELLIIYSASTLPAVMMIWLFQGQIIQQFFFNAVTSTQLLAITISAVLFFYVELMYQILQYRQQAQRVAIMQASSAVLYTALSYTSVSYFQMGITGIVWAQTTSIILGCLYALNYFWQNRTYISIQQSLKKIREYLPHSVPFIPTILANWLLSSSDRWILGSYYTLDKVGIYSTADIATQLFYALILAPWAGSYLPHIMRQFQHNKSQLFIAEKENKKIMWLCMISLAIAITLLYPVAEYVVRHILPAAYQEALLYAWYLLIGQIFLLGSYFCSALIQYHKRTYFLAFSLFIPALINIILNFIATPLWGIMGCTISTLISYAIYFMMTYLFNTYLLVTTQKGVLDETSIPASHAARPQSAYQFRK